MMTGVGDHSQVSWSALLLLLLYQSVVYQLVKKRDTGGHARDK